MTSVLTDEELLALRNYAGEILPREVEKAVLEKLSAGVSVEPSFFNVMDGKTAYIPYYTPKQFTTAIAAARVQENERCLALMDAIGCDWRDAGDMAKFYATNYLREAIRALLGKEST